MERIHRNVSSLIRAQQRDHQERLARIHRMTDEQNRVATLEAANTALVGFECSEHCGNPLVVATLVIPRKGTQIVLDGCCEPGIAEARQILMEVL